MSHLQPLWVIDFPMFEYDDKEKRWTAVHHPLPPKGDSETNLFDDPSKCKANAYDMVINGWEVGGGFLEFIKLKFKKKFSKF